MRRFSPPPRPGLLLLLAAASAWLAGCAGPPLPEEGPPVELARLALSQWTRAGPVQRYGPADLELLIAESADRCRSYEIVEAQAGRFERGEDAAEVILFRCRSTGEAFALYTARRAETGAGRHVEAGISAAAGRDAVNAWKGRYCLTVKAVSELPPEEAMLVALAREILENVAELSRRPKLVHALPPEHLVPGSELVFRCLSTLRLAWEFTGPPDLLRLSEAAAPEPAATGVYAQYVYASHDANLFVLVYRDPQMAQSVAKAFLDIYRPDSSTFKVKGWLSEVELKDEAWALAYQRGPLVILVPPTRSAPAAKATVAQYISNLAAKDA